MCTCGGRTPAFHMASRITTTPAAPDAAWWGLLGSVNMPDPVGRLNPRRRKVAVCFGLREVQLPLLRIAA